jgi:hypothetical protein
MVAIGAFGGLDNDDWGGRSFALPRQTTQARGNVFPPLILAGDKSGLLYLAHVSRTKSHGQIFF